MLRIPDRRRPQGLRDLAILYILFDTGLRVSALAGVRVCGVVAGLREWFLATEPDGETSSVLEQRITRVGVTA